MTDIKKTSEPAKIDLVGTTSKLVDELSAIYNKDTEFTVRSIVSVVTQAMIAVDKFAGLSGSDKKKVVLDAVKILINTRMQPGIVKDAIIKCLEDVVPSVIDGMVWNAKNGLTFNVKSSCLSCLSSLCS